MKRVTTVGVAGVLVALCGSTFAGTTTYSGTGSWHTGGNCSNGVPTEADRAVIPSGANCTIDGMNDAVADTIEVQTGGSGPGILNIADGRKLTLDNDNDNCCGAGADHSVINGIVNLQAFSTGSTLKFDENDHDLSGTGQIDGDYEGCKLQIAAGKTLTNNLATEGQGIRNALTIEGTGGNATFFNSGLLEAVRGTIILASSTILDDDTGAIWGLWCGSNMVFDRTATSLVGHFRNFSLGEHGDFVFNATVQTCGTYTRNHGGILINGNVAFRYRYFAGGQTGCGNPGSSTSPDPQCAGGFNEEVYEVTTSQLFCVTCDEDAHGQPAPGRVFGGNR